MVRRGPPMTPTPNMLADPAQIIADLQRANTELQRRLDESNAERDEALEQQTATAEVLGVINASPGDLAPVFDAVLEKALNLCEASFGGLQIWDGERLHRAAWRGISPELNEALEWQQASAPPPGSVAERLVGGENVISTADITQDRAFDRSP